MKQDIIDMATQVYGKCEWHESALLHLEALVKLVAKAEREACAKVCEEQSERWAVPVTSDDYRLMWAECAEAIRARGEQHG